MSFDAFIIFVRPVFIIIIIFLEDVPEKVVYPTISTFLYMYNVAMVRMNTTNTDLDFYKNTYVRSTIGFLYSVDKKFFKKPPMY